MPASMREAQAQDWLEDLREFGAEVVEAACREWRRKPGGRRPTPGDIRALCIDEKERRDRPCVRALPPPPADTRTLEEIAATRRELAPRFQEVIATLTQGINERSAFLKEPSDLEEAGPPPEFV